MESRVGHALMVGLLATSLGISSGSVLADSGVSMAVTPAAIEVQAGETFTVDLVIDTSVETSGAQCQLTFDPAVVRCDSIEKGAFYDANPPAGATVMWLGFPPTIDNDAGEIANAGVAIIPPTAGITGSGTFLKLTFTALADGRCEIGFKKAAVSDLQAANALDEPTPGVVTVGGGSGTPTTGAADLAVTATEAKWVTSGSTYEVTFAIKNQGGADAAASKTAVLVDGSVVATVDCPALAAGATADLKAGPFDFSGQSATVEVCADTDGAVTEGNENNNCKQHVLTAGAATPPTTPTTPTTTPTTPAPTGPGTPAPTAGQVPTPPAPSGEASTSGVNLPWVYVAGIGGAAAVAVIVLLVLRKNKGQPSGS
jgi:archaellum component FlaF (FlaF/FlaG flagellin family)